MPSPQKRSLGRAVLPESRFDRPSAEALLNCASRCQQGAWVQILKYSRCREAQRPRGDNGPRLGRRHNGVATIHAGAKGATASWAGTSKGSMVSASL